jgi:hypothetical protein
MPARGHSAFKARAFKVNWSPNQFTTGEPRSAMAVVIFIFEFHTSWIS